MAVLEPSNTELVHPHYMPTLRTGSLAEFGDLVEVRHLSVPILEPTWYATRGKRLFDVVASTLLAVLMVPFLAIAAIIVVLSLGRPLFYGQLRVGRNGRPFKIFKYRSMRTEPVIDLTDGSPMGLVVDVDNRTTSATRIMRALSLDELPQIFNVMRGTMSLVGPRPEVWSIAAADGLIDHPRNQVKPGMTGLWQISPKRQGEIVDGVELDLSYVSRMSLRQDLSILLRTPLAVARSYTE
ncbi:MAG: sugar transferase [Acidimicrobiales bacterium]